MTDLEKILLTSMLTILGGVFVYVVGQLISKFVIEPIQELRKVIGEVQFNLTFHASHILTPLGRTHEQSDNVSDALRKSSSDLFTKSQAIPFYRCVSRVSQQFLPAKNDVTTAAKLLRGLATYVHETGNLAESNINEVSKRTQKIEKLLRISANQQLGLHMKGWTRIGIVLSSFWIVGIFSFAIVEFFYIPASSCVISKHGGAYPSIQLLFFSCDLFSDIASKFWGNYLFTWNNQLFEFNTKRFLSFLIAPIALLWLIIILTAQAWQWIARGFKD